tara:strand:- start:828 stop:2360 length:1533 start_codon:yes stop_codon:yes gene_type:complete
VRYELYQSGSLLDVIYGISFYINATNNLELDINESTYGSNDPWKYSINSGSTLTAAAEVSIGDTIQLRNNVGNIDAEIIVPSELTVVGLRRLAPTTDAGEYIKIDLGYAVEATTLTLKSVAEYKEPTISMTDYNQYGYEVTASSENGSFPAYLAFNNLKTPLADRWICGSNTYDTTSGSYTGSKRLSTDYPGSGTNPTTNDGEYLMIKLPDKRKLVAYKLTRQDDTYYQFSPKDFTLYARESSTSDWVNLTSESLSASTPMGNYATGGGTRYPSTGDLTPTTAYQYYALVVETNLGSTAFALAEFELFCQPSEISEFKLYGSLDDSSWTEIHHETSVPAITSAGTNFQLLPYKFGSDLPANFGFGSDLPANFGQLKNTDFFDIHYWCVYPSDNTIIIAADANNDYLLFCRITQEGVDVAESSGFIEDVARPWVGNILSQEDLLSYYGTAEMNHLVGMTSSTFTKGTGFDGINVVNTYQYYGLVITKTKGYHNVSICEMKIGNESKIAINF